MIVHSDSSCVLLVTQSDQGGKVLYTVHLTLNIKYETPEASLTNPSGMLWFGSDPYLFGAGLS